MVLLFFQRNEGEEVVSSLYIHLHRHDSTFLIWNTRTSAHHPFMKKLPNAKRDHLW